eukprot:2705480-Ditylum_brightwellii.AAC.1
MECGFEKSILKFKAKYYNKGMKRQCNASTFWARQNGHSNMWAPKVLMENARAQGWLYIIREIDRAVRIKKGKGFKDKKKVDDKE